MYALLVILNKSRISTFGRCRARLPVRSRGQFGIFFGGRNRRVFSNSAGVRQPSGGRHFRNGGRRGRYRLDASATAAASAPLSELTVAPPTDYPDIRILNGYAFSSQAAFNPADPKRLAVGIVFGRRATSSRAPTEGKHGGPWCNCPSSRARTAGTRSRRQSPTLWAAAASMRPILTKSQVRLAY